jgi:type I restriction enzyme R subunit
MYIDKPMKGHGLMQAIARVNRVFRDKPAGLVVDYIGVAQNLKSALGQYSNRDREQTGIDEAEAIRVMLEKYEVTRAIFRPDTKGGFDYRAVLDPKATPQSRLAIMAGAIDWVLTVQQTDAAKEKTDEGKKRAHRRYADAVVALTKAFALSAASDEAAAIRDEVAFFQAIRAALIKSTPGNGTKSAAQRELAIQQLVSRAVVSTEIVDIMKAAGLESPDISILSDEFLAEIQQTDKKNLAIEALRKLINGDVRSRAKSNVTQSRGFTERLEAAIARYHNNALTAAQVIEELIKLAKDIRAARARGEETGLSDEEIAFYDALAENESARQVMGEPTLRVIAHELVTVIKGNVTVDWMHRDSARANIRRHVKRLLRKYGYPPDLQDAAVQNVLQQAEALSAEWTGFAS